MEPIINPWIFYLIDMVDGWICVLALIVVACWLLIIIRFRTGETVKSLIKIAIPFTIVALLIPSSSTIYKMVIADNVTPNNIQIVGESVEDGIDYIFDKINAVVEEMEVGNDRNGKAYS